MNEREIIEGNKLIAEFMGWRFDITNGYVEAYYQERKRWVEGDRFFNKLLIAKDAFGYHANWDALMPIIRKAKDYLQNMQRPSKNHCCKGDLIEIDLQCRLWEVDIEKTWLHVVELIKWIKEYEAIKMV